MENKIHKVIIIGSGPAGYTAAIYLGRAGYNPLVIAGALTPGGQLVNTTEVENYPGFPEGILGPDLMDAMQKQAEKFGAEVILSDVTSVDFNSPVKRVTTEDSITLRRRLLLFLRALQCANWACLVNRNTLGEEFHIVQPAMDSSSAANQLR